MTLSAPMSSLSPDARGVVERARAVFSREFGVPTWTALAPGRVNLIGEHVDYNGGCVLPMAIDRSCVAMGRAAHDAPSCSIIATDIGETIRFDLSQLIAGDAGSITEWLRTKRIARGDWRSYVVGVYALMRGQFPGGHAPPLDIVISSSVPLGSGLSSSAALEVSLATLLEHAGSIALDPVRKARLCQRAEHEFAGVPCGIMDQFISAMGRRECALLIDCRDESAEAVPMPGASEAVVVVINSNVRHSLASGEYAKRRATCASAKRSLGISEWSELPENSLGSGVGDRLTAEELRCARHVVSEIARTTAAVRALRRTPIDLAAFGRLMNESHASLRDDYRVSCEELDAIVGIVGSVDGVWGARMTGGGFGGCAIALVRPDAVPTLTSTLQRDNASRFSVACSVFATPACDGARAIDLGS